MSAKNAIDLGDIISTKLGDISINNTNPLAKTIDVGAIGSDATTMGNLTISGSGDITTGLIGNTTEAIATAGTISMTSTLGKVDFDNINTKVSAGLTVDMTAKTRIDQMVAVLQQLLRTLAVTSTQAWLEQQMLL